jgi:hypothetical protein
MRRSVRQKKCDLYLALNVRCRMLIGFSHSLEFFEVLRKRTAHMPRDKLNVGSSNLSSLPCLGQWRGETVSIEGSVCTWLRPNTHSTHLLASYQGQTIESVCVASRNTPEKMACFSRCTGSCTQVDAMLCDWMWRNGWIYVWWNVRG